MISGIYKKAILLSTGTLAGVAVTGTIMANPVQAATIYYRSDFSVTSNTLNGSELITGNFHFTKTQLAEDEFSYQFKSFNIDVINENIDLSDIKGNPHPFLAINQIFTPQKYQSILPSVLAGQTPNYIGDGDFPQDNFSFTFGFDLGDEDFIPNSYDIVYSSEDLENAGILVSNIVTSVDPDIAQDYVNLAFKRGGEFSLTSQEVPEPTTIFGIGVLGAGLTATRRRRISKKIKQKVAV